MPSFRPRAAARGQGADATGGAVPDSARPAATALRDTSPGGRHIRPDGVDVPRPRPAPDGLADADPAPAGPAPAGRRSRDRGAVAALDVPAASWRVTTKRVMARAQRVQYIALGATWLLLSSYFWSWWAQPAHAGNPGSPLIGSGLDLSRLFSMDPGPSDFSGAPASVLHPNIGAQ